MKKRKNRSPEFKARVALEAIVPKGPRLSHEQTFNLGYSVGTAQFGNTELCDMGNLCFCPRVRIHNQNMTTAASAQADRNTFGHLS